MSKRYLIVGGVAGGASVAARIRRLDESAEVIMFERGPYVSFSNCGLPFHLSKMVEKAQDLILMTPEVFKKQYNIQAKVNHNVEDIHPEEKTISVRNLETDEVTIEKYDYLALAPGAEAIMPKSIKGINSDHVFRMKTVPDVDGLQKYIDKNSVKDVAVVGAGFIGMETAENLKYSGLNVSLIEAADQVMAPFDYDMAQILHKELDDQGINLVLNDSVVEITDSQVILASGKTIEAQAVVMAIGVKPQVELAQKAGLELGTCGGIKVNHNFQTSNPFIYAVGDAIEVYDKFTRKTRLLTLAGPAQREARSAADHMLGKDVRRTGVLNSSVLKVFDLNAAVTGKNEKELIEAGIEYDTAYVIPMDQVGLMPEASPMYFKLIFAKPTGEILGAQGIGKGNVDKRVDVIATMITMNGTLDDLKELELCYSPLFGTAKDAVNHAALVGLNVLNGDVKQVPVTKVRKLVEQDAFIIDVREPEEYAQSHLINSVNIPMSEYRDRLDEIPKDQPVYVHCRSSQRSYNVARALGMLGFDNIYNIQGSYLGICLNEYYNDKTLNREPIVTDYNFN